MVSLWREPGLHRARHLLTRADAMDYRRSEHDGHVPRGYRSRRPLRMVARRSVRAVHAERDLARHAIGQGRTAPRPRDRAGLAPRRARRVRQLIALGRGLAHRVGTTVMILAVAVVAVAAAAAGPVYYQSARISILDDTLASATVLGRGYQATTTGTISGSGPAALRDALQA